MPRVRATVFFAYGFVLRNLLPLIRVAWLPLVLSTLTLYVTLEAYIGEVLSFLRTSDMRAASLGLGFITAGIFICLFFYAAMAVAVARFVLGKWDMRLRQGLRSEWRLFTAHLRLLLCSLAFVLVVTLLVGPARTIVPTPVLNLGVVVLTILVLCWLFARAGFLAPAIASSEAGPILRRAWSLTHGQSLRIAAIVVFLAVPAMLVQFAGEIGLRATADGPLLAPLAEQMAVMRQALPAFVAVLSLAIFLNIALMTAGCAHLYRSLVTPDARAI